MSFSQSPGLFRRIMSPFRIKKHSNKRPSMPQRRGAAAERTRCVRPPGRDTSARPKVSRTVNGKTLLNIVGRDELGDLRSQAGGSVRRPATTPLREQEVFTGNSLSDRIPRLQTDHTEECGCCRS